MNKRLQSVTFTDKGHFCLLRAVKKGDGRERRKRAREEVTHWQMSLLGNSTWKCCRVRASGRGGEEEEEEREREREKRGEKEVRRTRGHS